MGVGALSAETETLERRKEVGATVVDSLEMEVVAAAGMKILDVDQCCSMGWNFC